jgi:hypothetical protein
VVSNVAELEDGAGSCGGTKLTGVITPLTAEFVPDRVVKYFMNI